MWNLSNGHLTHVLKGHNRPVSSVDISPDGNLVISASYDGTSRVWNLQSGELLRTLQGKFMTDILRLILKNNHAYHIIRFQVSTTPLTDGKIDSHIPFAPQN